MLNRIFTGFKALPQNVRGPNCWDILGIPSTSTIDEVNRAYRKLAEIHHPDKITGSGERFIVLQKAYEQAINYLG